MQRLLVALISGVVVVSSGLALQRADASFQLNNSISTTNW